MDGRQKGGAWNVRREASAVMIDVLHRVQVRAGTLFLFCAFVAS
jgi:hypothetical protein